jgi:hypothetical protein
MNIECFQISKVRRGHFAGTSAQALRHRGGRLPEGVRVRPALLRSDIRPDILREQGEYQEMWGKD